jgi:hypothetical protein
MRLLCLTCFVAFGTPCSPYHDSMTVSMVGLTRMMAIWVYILSSVTSFYDSLKEQTHALKMEATHLLVCNVHL